MNHRPLLRLLPRLLDASIVVCLIVTLGSLIYGHVGGETCGLSLTDSYITEYMKMAPHWPWLIVASFSFALLLSLMAFAFLLRGRKSPLTMLGCLLLAAASMGVFFVAYTPMRRVEQPPPSPHEWWAPRWWFTSQTSRTPYEHGMADAYSDVHYRATRLVVITGVTAMFLLAGGVLRLPEDRTFAWFTLTAVVAMAILFMMADHLEALRGLWQRLGFAIMYGWLPGLLFFPSGNRRGQDGNLGSKTSQLRHHLLILSRKTSR